MMLKLLHLAELVDINIKYMASNASLMMSLSVGYPDSKFNPFSVLVLFRLF